MTLNIECEPESLYRPGYVYLINLIGTRKYRISLAKQDRLKSHAQEIIRECPQCNIVGWIEVCDCYAAKNVLKQHFSAYGESRDFFEIDDHNIDDIACVYGEVMAKYWIEENLSVSEEKPTIADEYNFFDSVSQYCDQYREVECFDNSQSSYASNYEESYQSSYSSGSDDSFSGWIIGVVIFGLIVLLGATMNKFPKIDFPFTSDRGQSRIANIDVLPDDGRFLPNHRIDASVIGKSAAFIRSGPNQKDPAVGEPLVNRTPIKTINRSPDGEWFYVQTENEIKGWVYGSLIR